LSPRDVFIILVFRINCRILKTTKTTLNFKTRNSCHFSRKNNFYYFHTPQPLWICYTT